MYLEGALFASVLGSASQQSKLRIALLVLLWPIALPIAGCILYKKFSPLINEVRTNPFLKAMIQTQTGGQTPSLFQVNNPFESEDALEMDSNNHEIKEELS